MKDLEELSKAELIAEIKALRKLQQTETQNTEKQIASEIKLKESEEKIILVNSYLNNIINNIEDPLFVKDDQSRLLLVNDAFCSIFDLSRDYIIGKTLAEDVHKEERESFLRIDNQVLADGIENIQEEYLTVRGGKTKFITTKKTRFIDENDKKHLIGIIHDVTEQKKAEEELIQNTQLLNTSQSIAKLGGWELNIETGNLFWTTETYRIHDTSPEEFNPTVDAGVSYFLPESRKIILNALDAAINEGNSYDLVLETHTTKGRLITVRTTCEVSLIDGKPAKLTGIFQDITEQKAAEKELEESLSREKLMADIVRKSIVGIAVGYPDGSIGMSNAAFQNITGYTEQELQTINWNAELTPKKWEKSESAKLEELHRTKKPVKYEKEYINKDGSIVPIELIVNPQFDTNGEVECYFAFVIDISERIQTNNEKKRLYDDLGERVKELGCLYGISKIIEKTNVTLEQVFEESVRILPPSWRYPEVACAKITFENSEYKTKDFVETKWKQSANLTIQGKISGEVTVCYLQEKPDLDEGPFSIEERNLIQGVAERLQKFMERKQAIEALKESEDRLNSSQKIGKIGHWEYDFKVTQLIWSKQVYDLYERDEKLGPPGDDELGDFYYEKDHLRLREYMVQIMETLKPVENFECPIILPSGRIINTQGSMYPVLDKEGAIRKIFGTVQDITDRKESEEALKESEERFELAMTAAKDGLYDWNLLTNEIYYSPGWKSMLGYKDDEVPNHLSAWEELVEPKDAERSWAIQKEVLDKKRDRFEIEFKMKHKDGHYVDVLSRAEAIFDENGLATRMIGTHSDISERKLMENQLIIAKENAVESDRLKSAFLANMSHEIRTPMNGILGFSELLKKPNLSGEDQRKYIGVIQKSGDRMLNIINDIVSISKIESGLMQVNMQESNINEQIEFIYNFFKPEVESKGIHFTYNSPLPTAESIIKTDREKLYAILTNLVKNAIKFTEKGSLDFGYLPKNNSLEFYVKDTGIGIQKNRQKAIFERFIQADIEDKNAYQGAGLGLSISTAYVKMLGGEIWVESEIGKGTCFFFTLPLDTNTVNETRVKREVSRTIDESGAKKLKILIAEDDEASQQLISIYVEEISYEIINVETGAKAVDTCRKNPDIDLILMDILMPGMDGLEATRKIRAFNNDVVIIAQTAFGLQGDKEKSISAGCNDHISKPINKIELINLIERTFQKKNN